MKTNFLGDSHTFTAKGYFPQLISLCHKQRVYAIVGVDLLNGRMGSPIFSRSPSSTHSENISYGSIFELL